MNRQHTSALGSGRSELPDRLQWLRNAHVDVPLLVGLLVIIGLGLLVLYSATGQDLGQVGRQAVRFAIGLVIMFILAQIPPQHFERWSLRLFALGIVLLLAVIFLGESSKGAQRWLNLGIVRFQPSELMKLAVPMMLAWLLSDAQLPPRFFKLVACLAALAVPVLLVGAQPDLGTALLIGSAGFFVLFMAGLRWRLIIGTVLVGAAAAYPLWTHVLKGYQRQRVLTFLNPENDPLGTGYHFIQSQIAIGSGGIYGKGWHNGTQSQLEFLPERSTDFIFAVIGEEFGLLGSVVLLAAYLFLVIRGLIIALHAQDTYSRLLAASISLTFFIYVYVNTGMVAGLLPVVGVPLPLVSYGGTSIVTVLAGFGILMSIQSHRKLLTPTV